MLDRTREFVPDVPIACACKPLQMIHGEADALWVLNPEDAQVGAQITQTRMLGTHQELSQAFFKAWAERTSPLNVGTPSVNLPVTTCRLAGSTGIPCQPLTCLSLRLSAPRSKVPTPGSPSGFRPITVFRLLYRCWSSFHARKSLACLGPFLPDTLFGSRQGRHANATQLWSKLLWTMKWAYERGVEMAGVVLDLQKAFNMLPRVAVFEIAAHVGLPGYIMVGWAGALSAMKRHFLIRQSLSDGIMSTTGVPEGCGLSCVGMVLIDAAFYRWQQVYFPLCTALWYVDDWRLLCSHQDFVQGACQSLQRF